MAGNVVSVPFNFGRQDRIAPKFAPFGVLGQVKNLRHRQMGGIGLRNGYQPLAMNTVDGTLAAYDLHEYSGRLIALGADGGDGFPREIFEYLGFTNEAWRAQTTGQRQFITPFTNLREMIGTPLCEGGVTDFDAAAGGGYVCMAYIAAGSAASFLLVIDPATQQAIHQESLANGWGGGGITASELRVCYQGGRFYIGGRLSNNTIRILRFSPGSSQFVGTHVASISGGPFTTWDMAPATNLTNGTATGLVIAYGTSSAIAVRRYDHTGSQLGSTISFSATSASSVQVEGDETDSSLTVFWVEGGSAKLKSYSLAGSTLAGPTTIATATSGSLCRLFAQGSLATSVVVAYNDGSSNTPCKVYTQAAHVAGSTVTLQQVTLQSRPVNAQCASNTTAWCVSGLAPSAATTPTNALFWVSTSTIHMASRDSLEGKPISRMVNLTRDSTTGQLCWTALRDPGVQSQGMPVISLADFYSQKRRQGAKFGSLLYLAGAPVTAYDGRFTAESGFAEPPVIVSIAPTTGGSLTPSARYSYVVHFEYTFADGSLIPSAPSLPFEGDTGASDTANTVVATTPHSNRIAGSSALFGADIIGVLSRTVWTPSYGHAVVYTKDVNALPPVPMTGLTLLLAVDGGLTQTVTFTSNSVGANGIRADIVAQATGITVTETPAGSGILALQTVSQDQTSSIVIQGTTVTGFARWPLGLNGASAVGLSGGIQGSVYRRSTTKSAPGGVANYGKTLSFTDTTADTTAATAEALYTQAARGPLSGILEHDDPRACSFIAATESRLVLGGLSLTHQFQVSKEAYLGESFEFSDFSSFFGQISREIVGIAALDRVVFLCTRGEFFAFASSGPDDLGGGGITPPTRLPTLTGLKDWRSFLEIPDGLMCQLDDDKLHLIPRGGGAPTWVGQDILNELDAYPTITGSARHRADNTAVFAANVTGLTSAKLLVYDLVLKTWFVDEPPLETSSGIAALVNFGRTIAYSSNGVVYLQSDTSFTDGASSPITGQLTTRPLYPFGIGGYGQIYDGLLSFEFRGACSLQCRVSYDDGQTFTALTTYTLTGTSGQQMRRKWTFPQATTTSVVIELTMIPTGSGTEGILFNQLDLLVHPEPGLPELLPAEMGSA